MASLSQEHSDFLKQHAIWIALGCSLIAMGVILVPSAKPLWWVAHVFIWLLAAWMAGLVDKAARSRAPSVDHYLLALLIALLPLWTVAFLPFLGCLGITIYGLAVRGWSMNGLWANATACTLVLLPLAWFSVRSSSWRHAWMLLLGPAAGVAVALFETDLPRGGALIALALLVAILLERASNLRRVLNIPIPGTCAKCGYDLEGVVASVCPECGSSIQRPERASNTRRAWGVSRRLWLMDSRRTKR